jgi:hypothetical protein
LLALWKEPIAEAFLSSLSDFQDSKGNILRISLQRYSFLLKQRGIGTHYFHTAFIFLSFVCGKYLLLLLFLQEES